MRSPQSSAFAFLVVPYIGTWIETAPLFITLTYNPVVPYIGTWIETPGGIAKKLLRSVVPYIGTWIETIGAGRRQKRASRRTLYRYVD